MKIEELKETVFDTISNEASSMQLYFVLKRENEFALKLADIEDEKTMPELMQLFSDNLTSTIVNNGEIELRSLTVEDPVENALYIYDYSEYSDALKVFNDFAIKEAIETGKFDFSVDSLSSLFGYIVYIGTMDRGITLFKKHYPVSLIQRDSFLLGIKKAKKRFEKISGEDILRINGDWQLIKVNGKVFVKDLSVLEKYFGFTKLIEKEAKNAIKAIEQLDVLENVETLYDELETLSFERKLVRILRASIVFEKKISAEKILEFSRKTPALSGRFIYSDSGKKIVLSTKKQKDAFLQLLNDDFLLSELTSEYYAARAKDKV